MNNTFFGCQLWHLSICDTLNIREENQFIKAETFAKNHKSLKPSGALNQISSLTGGSLFPSYMYARILQVSLKVEHNWTNKDAWED